MGVGVCLGGGGGGGGYKDHIENKYSVKGHYSGTYEQRTCCGHYKFTALSRAFPIQFFNDE